MWGPVIIIIVIEYTVKDSRGVRNAYWVYFVDCVSKIKSIISFIFHAMYGAVSRAVCIQHIHFSCDDCENACNYFILLSSSNRKYDPFTIV